MNPHDNSHDSSSAHHADQHMNQLLDQASRHAWTGSDHSPRVDEFLKGIKMKAQSRYNLSRSAITLLGVGALAGASLGAAVTHQILTHRATIITDDGTQYDVELTETPDGAAGTFVTEDGAVYGVEMVESGGQKNVTVDINSPAGGTSTVILDGVAPRVTTLPGQTARIEIGTSEGEESETADDTQSEDAKTDGDDASDE